MSDQLAGKIGFNQGGQTGQSDNSGGQPPVQPGNQEADQTPKYVTKEDMAVEFKRLQKMIDSQVRGTDKRVIQKLTEFLETSKQSGVQVTPDQIEKIREHITDAITANEPESPTAHADANAPAQGSKTSDRQLDPVSEWAEKLFTAAGIPENAPELSLVDTKTNDENLYKASVTEAIAAYQKRIARPGSNPANVPAFAARGSGAGEDKTQLYIQEMLAAAGKGNEVGREIKDRYRELGVPVDSIRWKMNPR